MSKSRGKKFETEISRHIHDWPHVGYIRRHPDTGGERFRITNPIDFSGSDKKGQALFVECKAIKGTSMPFDRFSDGQWDALMRCLSCGARVDIALNHHGWPGQSGRRGKAYCIPFAHFVLLRSDLQQTRMSWPVAELVAGATVELVKVTGERAGWIF